MHMQQNSKRRKQLPFLHHCAHVLELVMMDVTITRQKLILLLRFVCNAGLVLKGIGSVINK